MFDTNYNEETILNVGTAMTALDDEGNVVQLGVATSMTQAERTALNSTNAQLGLIVYDTTNNRFFGLRNSGWVSLHN